MSTKRASLRSLSVNIVLVCVCLQPGHMEVGCPIRSEGMSRANDRLSRAVLLARCGSSGSRPRQRNSHQKPLPLSCIQSAFSLSVGCLLPHYSYILVWASEFAGLQKFTLPELNWKGWRSSEQESPTFSRNWSRNHKVRSQSPCGHPVSASLTYFFKASHSFSSIPCFSK